MESHLDPDHNEEAQRQLAERLVGPTNQAESLRQFHEKLAARAAIMKEAGQSKIASNGIENADGWEAEGVTVKKLEDDPQGILRVSIGGGDHLPIQANYCAFRGPREACITLLERALAALKADR